MSPHTYTHKGERTREGENNEPTIQQMGVRTRQSRIQRQRERTTNSNQEHGEATMIEPKRCACGNEILDAEEDVCRECR